MPGLVVRILANEGDEIPKGGSLLVLEAMKMENIIKSPEEVTIASIEVSAGDAVEKNQSLIKFK
jgi:biotin carboxyl carrier protein